ncbi:phosphoglucosamine mutase [Candidatus Saccharibacteria bacterium]|nr:phosphoglucosamine mutase [Candidatus Saccharibacteria bacterium]
MKHFGTDGIRKPAADFTPDLIYQIIRGLATYAGPDKKIFISGDTRESTEWMLRDCEIACETLGLDCAPAGVLPTPAINYCFYQMGYDFAIDITASHNPYTDNGIKIFERDDRSGQKLSPAGCEKIEATIENPIPYTPVAPTDRENLHYDALELYAKHLRDYLGPADFTGLHIGLDCANGATSVINSQIFEALGATVHLINADHSYGTKINHNCGSTHLEELTALVKKEHLDFGVAYDGDGDRCLMIDESGAEIDGDQIIAILANYLHLDAIAVTVMANQGLLNWAATNNVKTVITPVGDSNVAAAMEEQGIKIGGEQSGHIILPGEPTGDGILTSLMLAKVIAETKTSLHTLASIYTKSPQVIVNLPANSEQKKSLASSDAAKSILTQFEEKVKGLNGRLLVRPSGTEPLIRITVWGDNEQQITALAEELKTKLGETL